MRRAIPSLLAATLLAAIALAVPAGAAENKIHRVVALETGVLAEINAVRARHGRAPLRLSPRLSAAANVHSKAMASKGFFSHSSADGSDFAKRVKRFYRPARYGSWAIGENILWRSPAVDAREAVAMWLASPPHRANLLDRGWREIGLAAIHAGAAPGVYHGLEVIVLTADFGVRR